VLRILTAGALLVLSCGCLRAQGVEPRGRPDFGFAIHFVTPTNGVDFTNFAKDLFAALSRQCAAKMSQPALMGEREKVVVRVTIQKDGTLGGQPPIVEESSGKNEVDAAAVNAVRSAAPFDHLPDAFDGPSIELRLAIAYKERP